MAFDSDAEAQLQIIWANLSTCSQTSEQERTALGSVIEGVVNSGVATTAPTLDSVGAVQGAIRRKVEDQGWYFRGSAHTVGTNAYLSTRNQDKIRRGLARSLGDQVAGLSEADSLDMADALIYELSAHTTFTAAKLAHDKLPLHRHGSPMWIATAVVEDWSNAVWLEHVPARLGLAPDLNLPVRYILMRLRPVACHIPRFADSGGYPYWAPGGLTKPIEQCPTHLTGFEEIVSDGLTINQIGAELIFYSRTI